MTVPSLIDRRKRIAGETCFQVLLSAEGEVLTWDAGAERVFNRAAPEALRRPFADAVGLPAPTVAEAVSGVRSRRAAKILDAMTGSDGRKFEIWLLPVGKGGVLAVGRVAAKVERELRSLGDVVRYADATQEEISQLREMSRAIMESLAESSALLESQQDALAEALALESQATLYDRLLRHDLVNIVTALGLHLELLSRHAGDPQAVRTRIVPMRKLLQRLVVDARTVPTAGDGDHEGPGRHVPSRGPAMAPPPKQPLDVGEALKEATEVVRALHAEHRFELRLRPPSEPLLTPMRPGLQQALVNLLSNAVRHNPKPIPRVWVEAETRGASREVEVRIADDGPGIPQAVRAALSQAPNTLPPAPIHGMGLVVSHEIIRRAGGTLAVGNRVPDDPRAGALLRVSLPRWDT